MQKIIDAENSDLYDVLGACGLRAAPLTARKGRASEDCDQQPVQYEAAGVSRFVLSQYVKVGVEELDGKLSPC